jgi:hypothetical protein
MSATVVQTDARPTVRQVYAITRAMLDAIGESFPQTRGEASALIERLRATAPATRDESVPF